MAKCTICKKEIILVPSAAERAKKYGKTAAFYTSLFTEHAQCTIDKRERETLELMRRIKGE